MLLSKHRIEALADGVYAIAITLLVLELKLPLTGEHTGAAELRQALIGLLPKLLVWLLSFWVMAEFWLAQQRVLRHVATLDRWGLRIELMQLALVSLLPFSTALIGEHGNLPLAAAIYSAHLLGMALLSLWRIQHLAHRPQLHAQTLASSLLRGFRLRALAVAGFAALALGLAFVWPGWNMLAMLGLLFLPLLIRPAADERAGPASDAA